MKLNTIELHHFRSYRQQSFVFNPEGNLIIGPNGSGKTNLMEAVAYTSLGKSIRFHQDKELIHNKETLFAVNALYAMERSLPLKVHLSYDGSRKVLKFDDATQKQLSSLYQRIKVIYCAPDDIALINGNPRQRRQYFDLAISQVFPEYIGLLRDYLHIVDQRNRMLKGDIQIQEKKSWDHRFVKSMIELYPYRQRYLAMLNAELQGRYREISSSTRDLQLYYIPVLRNAPELNEAEMWAQIELYDSRERMWQRSLMGAHLDDYSFRMGDFGMRAFASQGQKRIAVIILKMIHAQLVESNTRIKPIILFDDVFAELDYNHGERIHDLCRDSYQFFIASPKEDIRQIFGKMSVIRLGASV